MHFIFIINLGRWNRTNPIVTIFLISYFLLRTDNRNSYFKTIEGWHFHSCRSHCKICSLPYFHGNLILINLILKSGRGYGGWLVSVNDKFWGCTDELLNNYSSFGCVMCFTIFSFSFLPFIGHQVSPFFYGICYRLCLSNLHTLWLDQVLNLGSVLLWVLPTSDSVCFWLWVLQDVMYLFSLCLCCVSAVVINLFYTVVCNWSFHHWLCMVCPFV